MQITDLLGEKIWKIERIKVSMFEQKVRVLTFSLIFQILALNGESEGKNKIRKTIPC